MTTEQKVLKKAKGKDALKYKKGVAVVLLTIDESASEYQTESEYYIRLYFKSKAAINRVSKLLGELRFNKKNMLARFERGNNSIEIRVSPFEKMSIEGGENIIHNVQFSYHNDYSGRRFDITLDPRKPLSPEEREYRTGSVADSESLAEYFDYLQSSIIKGDMQYILQ